MQHIKGTGETVTDSKQPLKTVRDMQKLHGDSERQSVTMRDSERPVATPWQWERLRETASYNDRHIATPLDWKKNSERQPAIMGDS